MKKYSKKWFEENSFFVDEKTGRKKFNELCKKCQLDCKQSFKVEILNCNKFVKR